MDAHGNPFNLGRTVRHANRKQRRALRAIYRSCGFPGCDVGFWKCDIHHIVPWELGGFTDLANMVPICSRHHHVIHEGGWQLNLAPDRTLTITQPTGQPYGTTTPDINRQTPHSRAGPPNDSIGEPPPESLVEPIRTQRVDRPPKPPERRPVGPDDPRQQMNLLTG